MGIYINPPDMSKEEWLKENASEGPLLLMPQRGNVPQGSRRVCLVDNRAFSAAGVAFDEDEAAAFNDPDGRDKRWFIVTDELLEEVTGVTLPENRPATGERL